jgi:hypothetical protein
MIDTVLAEEVDPAKRTLPWVAAEEGHHAALYPTGSRQPSRLPEMALRAGSIYQCQRRFLTLSLPDIQPVSHCNSDGKVSINAA